MATTQQPRRTTDRRRARTRAALIDAAIELFGTLGVDETTVEQICERADVSPRTFFNHFETRDQLYAALASHRLEGFAALMDKYRRDERPLATRLAELFDIIGSGASEGPEYRGLVGAMARATGHVSSRDSSLGRAVFDFVRDGVDRGQITSSHPADVLADIVTGALSTAITNWSASASFDLPHELDRLAATLSDLLAS